MSARFKKDPETKLWHWHDGGMISEGYTRKRECTASHRAYLVAQARGMPKRENSPAIAPPLEPDVLTDRACLRCGNTFKSSGIHNRLCRRCVNKSASFETIRG